MSCSSSDASSAQSAATASSAEAAQSDPGWMKKIFGSDKPDPNANVQPGFVALRSDFNVRPDGLPATTVRSFKSGGRKIR